jgi:SAM-dependent methyltransferase
MAISQIIYSTLLNIGVQEMTGDGLFRRISEIYSAIRQRGLRFLWDYFRESIWFDLRYGTSTFSRVPKTEQTINSSNDERENGLLYVASFTSVTRKTVEHARSALSHIGADAVQFIDLGCGKGKALLVYAKDFSHDNAAKAIGIEYDPALADRARDNLKKAAFAHDRVQVITDSATNLHNYIERETAIIYLYNSFQGETLDRVLDALTGLRHVLIYVDPAERWKLPERGYTVIAENTGRYNADTWLVATSPDLTR